MSHYHLVCLLIVTLLSSILLNNDNIGKSNNIKNRSELEPIFFQKSFAIEEDSEDEEKDSDTNDNNKKKDNFVAVGDWDCNDDAEETVENIIDQDPEVILALGDLSYNGKAKCWLELIEPIADKTNIVFGNHEDDLIDDYKDYFGLEEQYYSFNYKNIHFLALSTEADYDDDSEQYEFAIRDLEKYSKDPFIDWIVVFYHYHIYGSGSLEEDTDFRETYHPVFDKYNVDLALQGHSHVYERTYPITFNNDDDEPIVQDENPNIYKNSNGVVFITVGTGGAEEMVLSSLEDFSAEGIDGDFGILNIVLESDRKTLTGTFIENGKKKEVKDEFKIIKDKT
ncbi:MAG: metallophosphoesterase [Nitrososphaeraceae archaeon]